MSFERELQVALEAVRQAAQLCRNAQPRAAALQKDDRSPVTVADFGSQALIGRALGLAFPRDPLIAEEASDALGGLSAQVLEHVRRLEPRATPDDIRRWIDSGRDAKPAARFWTLDPVDGTKGFLAGRQYAIALALVVAGRLEVAVLACPNLPAIFSAVRGLGAFAHQDDRPVRIRVSDVSDPATARWCESVEPDHSSHEDSQRTARRLGITLPPIRIDSQAKYGLVARGDAEIYLRFPTREDYRENIWDHAAGTLVVTEAGGHVTDHAGRALDFSRGSRLEANRGIVVTNGRLHDRVLDAVSRLR